MTHEYVSHLIDKSTLPDLVVKTICGFHLLEGIKDTGILIGDARE